MEILTFILVFSDQKYLEYDLFSLKLPLVRSSFYSSYILKIIRDG